MKPKLSLFLVVLLFAFSCTKKEDVVKAPEKTLLVGNSEGMLITHYSSAAIVKGTMTGTSEDYLYHDSIKVYIDFDEQPDLTFYYYKHYQEEEDCPAPMDCMPWAERKFTVVSLSGIEIACDENTSYPIVFQGGEKFSSIGYWNNTGTLILRSDNFGPNGVGNWYEQNDRYLVFRKIQNNKTYYGWIKLSTINDQIELKEFAMESSGF